MEPGTTGERRSLWSYAGCGCAGLVVMGLLGITGLTWVSYQAGQEMQEGFKDPAVRAQKVQEILPHRELPPGYHAWGATSIPFLMKTAILSDREPPVGAEDMGQEEFGARGFLYMSFRSPGVRQERLGRFVQGEGGEGNASIETGNLKFEVERPIRTGRLQAGGGTVEYGIYRGESEPMGRAQARTGAAPKTPSDPENRRALIALLNIDCPQDNWARTGIWYGPDPAPNQPAEGPAFNDTPANPRAIQGFLEHFEICPEGQD